MGVLMTPRATALTRTPCDAYSIASERATAASPPLVRAASAAGVLSAWSTRLVLTLTTCPLPWVDHLPDGALGDVEEPGQVHGGDRRIVVGV